MDEKKPNIFIRLVRSIWRGLMGFRKFMHLIVMLLLFVGLMSVFSSGAPVLPTKAALVIAPTGALTEQLAGDPFDRALDELTDSAVPQALVRDIVAALEYAANDKSIPAVYLQTDGLFSADLTKLQAVATAIEKFRESGKPVIAHAAFYSQPGYYLAVHADEVILHPNGQLILQGYGRYRNYYREAIEKLSIEWNVFKVGTHKSFVEPYTRNDMSDQDREFASVWLGQMWEAYKAAVSGKREFDAETLQHYADELDVVMGEYNGDLAKAAVGVGLVDSLATTIDMRKRMIEMVGESKESEGTFNQISYTDYVRAKRVLNPKKPKADRVAVVVAAGSIVDGSAAPGTIGGDSTARLLRQARTDEKVKAVVLRVDSGGGSAFASDVILAEVLQLREAGKPVIASMGGVAASGGYWISMAADQIVANENTITGSIGILGMFPTFQNSLARIGVHTDGVGTTNLAGQGRPDMALSDRTKRILQLSIEAGYRQFIEAVAKHRNMSTDAVNAVGQGKVWSGRDALAHGLIDSLGNQADAVAIAAERAGLSEGEYSVTYIEPKLSAEEQFVLDLFDASASVGLPVKALLPGQTPLSGVLGVVNQKLSEIARFNDPGHTYADCFCSAEIN